MLRQEYYTPSHVIYLLFRFLQLDTATLSVLNVLPESEPGNNKERILGILDNCVTPQGHNLIEEWIKQPLCDAKLINDRHNVVQCFVENICVSHTVTPYTTTSDS